MYCHMTYHRSGGHWQDNLCVDVLREDTAPGYVAELIYKCLHLCLLCHYVLLRSVSLQWIHSEVILLSRFYIVISREMFGVIFL